MNPGLSFLGPLGRGTGGKGPVAARSNGGVNGPKGRESIAQALAWVTSKKRVSPVGAKENGISRSLPGRAFIREGSGGDILFWRRQANLIASKGMLSTN